MRPRNLKIEGFTCFREPVEVDFTGMDVFVIAGPTGSGKTTLIDAICYALYGKVPRGTTVKDLIAHDASEMKVQLEFESGGRIFRVHRGYNVTRTTNKKTGGEKISPALTPVQFEEQVAGDWDGLHDRVANINEAIDDVVGLDFESFTKCVLLPQGRFAEFLTGKPDERRRILVDLLDMGIYTRLMQTANARAAMLQTQIADRERQLAEDYANATEEALEATREQLAAAKPLLDTERDRRDALQLAVEHATQVVKARRDEKAGRDALDTKSRELKDAEKAAKDGAKTLAGLTDALEAAETELKRSPYDATLHGALVRAESCAKQAERARVTLETARAAASDRAVLDAAEKAASTAGERHVAAREAVSAAEQILREAQRADAASHLRSGLKVGDPCPVCGGVVGKLAKAEKSGLNVAERALTDARTSEAAAADTAGKARTALARAQQAFESATQKVVDAETEFARADGELGAALPDGMTADAGAISARLAEQEKARATHDAIVTDVDHKRRALHEHREQIAGSDRRIAALNAEIAQLTLSVEKFSLERQSGLSELNKITAKWQWGDVIDLVEAKTSPVDLLKEMRDASQRETEEITRRIATFEADEKAIEQKIARAAELREALAGMKERWQLCKDLAVLLRADNFQQFVLVEAMEQLAESASEHLRTLFDRFGIRVDGSEFAVVDHWQADQVRPAKTLSGGETFVASLALALALAERLPELRSAAAASLESLFLDEGFGTLDAETLDTVIEALEGLRSEERMVGVITHVPELTQRIEHRIIVRKSQSGSSVAVAGAVA